MTRADAGLNNQGPDRETDLRIHQEGRLSKEHKRSLFAFLLVALACLVIVSTGLRSNAVQGIIRDRAADVVAGGVLSRIAQHRPAPAPPGHPVRRSGLPGHPAFQQPAHQGLRRPALPARQDARSNHDARVVPADAHAHVHAKGHAAGRAAGRSEGRSEGRAEDHGRHLGWGSVTGAGHDRGHGHAYARGHARP